MGAIWLGEDGFLSSRTIIGFVDLHGTVDVGEGTGFFYTKKEVGRVDIEGNVWLGDGWKEQKLVLLKLYAHLLLVLHSYF